jgi:hypothetical protein
MTCGITVAPTMPEASRTLPVPSNRAGVGRVDEDARDEADRDEQQEGHDDALEGALPPQVTDAQDDERDRDGDELAEHQRDVEENREGDRAADDLGHVRRDRHGLGLQPVGDARAGSHARAEQPGQGHPGDGAELGREVLHQHRREARADDDPDQRVAEGSAGGDVGRDVARVDVGDGSDEGRSDERESAGPRTR